MARSVSYASGSIAVCYRDIGYLEEDYQWRDFVEWVQDTALDNWPTFKDCDYWLGREDRAILENRWAYIGVSEYCGLASIWLVPKEPEGQIGLASKWCQSIIPTFKKTYGELVKVTTFSNGEAIFKRVA